MEDLRSGSTFAGHLIEDRAGRGGMGVVYRATDLRLERRVALKLVKSELADDDAFATRFMRESRLAASIDHPNVIPIYQSGEEDGRLFLAMRFVDGTDLADVLERDRRLAPERAVRIVAQVAAALDAAHARGLVHRDVKPANILIERRGEGEHVYLTDFGLTKHTASESRLTKTGALVGTVDYVAPEQVEGEDVDGRADVYALGCVAFQMLSGHVPFQKPNPMAKLFAHVHEDPPSLAGTGVPDELAAVVRRAMEKEPGRRFQSAGEFAHAAAAAIGVSLPSTAAGSGPVVMPRSRAPRRRRVALVGALAAAAAVVAVALLLTGGGDEATEDESAAVTAVLGRVHQGFSSELCRNDLTENMRARFFAPRSGQEALNACENLGGGPPNRKPLVVDNLTIQGDTASAQIIVEDEPATFYLVKRGSRWLVDDFSETDRGRYERQITTSIQPGFRITPALDKFISGQLPLSEAEGLPRQATRFLRGAVTQIESLDPPAGLEDIHRRLVAAMRAQLAAVEDAAAAQREGDAKAFERAGRRIFPAIEQLGMALEDLQRAR